MGKDLPNERRVLSLKCDESKVHSRILCAWAIHTKADSQAIVDHAKAIRKWIAEWSEEHHLCLAGGGGF